jgi:hypothetical protein
MMATGNDGHSCDLFPGCFPAAESESQVSRLAGLREPRKKALSFQGVLKSLTCPISVDLIALFAGASVLLAAPNHIRTLILLVCCQLSRADGGAVALGR